MVQTHIFYSGTVQGVGFRYTVQRFAKELQLKGWVRNLSDGRVEILVEGEEAKIQELTAKIDQRYDGYIKNKQAHNQPAHGAFQEFEITA